MHPFTRSTIDNAIIIIEIDACLVLIDRERVFLINIYSKFLEQVYLFFKEIE